MNSNSNERKGYRTAFKATSLFGGVQVVTILIGILKSKLVAVWLGVTGFGIMGLFNSSMQADRRSVLERALSVLIDLTASK